jgi:hypothetical protein
VEGRALLHAGNQALHIAYMKTALPSTSFSGAKKIAHFLHGETAQGSSLFFLLDKNNAFSKSF